MNQRNPITIDPALENNLAGILEYCMTKYLQSNVSGSLPAKIIAYDREQNRAQVQPMITIVGTSGQQYPRAQLASVPVLVLGGGDLMINFPIKTGDLGWIIASDRDISIFLQTYTQSPPNTSRMFSFSDAFFIPDIMRDYTINAEDTDAMVISTKDGTTRISISPTTGINITSPLIISMTTPTFHVHGNITASGTITPGTPP